MKKGWSLRGQPQFWETTSWLWLRKHQQPQEPWPNDNKDRNTNDSSDNKKSKNNQEPLGDDGVQPWRVQRGMAIGAWDDDDPDPYA